MDTYLKKHSATDLVKELKKRMRSNDEEVKSKEQAEELKMRMRREMMMKEDEMKRNLMKKQERLTSSLLKMNCSQMVKRVTRYTTSYYRQSPRASTSPPSSSAVPSGSASSRAASTSPPSSSARPPGSASSRAASQVKLPAQDDSLKEREREIQDALHIRLCQVVEQCAPRGVYTGGQERRAPPAAPGRDWARTSSRRPAGAPRGRVRCPPVRSSRNTLYISRPPTLPALQSEPWQLAPAPSVIPPLTWPLPQELRPSCPPPGVQEEEEEEDDDDEEGEEEDDGEEEGEDDGDEEGEEEDNGEEGEEEDDGEEEGEDDGGEEEDYPEEDADGQPIDDEDYPVTGPANYGVEVIEYDEVGREDRTDDGQPHSHQRGRLPGPRCRRELL